MSTLAMVAMIFVPSLALAQVPQNVGYQGRLLNADGSSVIGPTDITFAIYDVATSGSVLWTETQQMGLTDGYYAAVLGSVKAFPVTLFNGSTRYLSIGVAGQELLPRQEIAATPYALRAGSVSLSVGPGLTGDGSPVSPLSAVKTPHLAQFDFEEGAGLSSADSSGNGARLTISNVGTTWQVGHVAGTNSVFFDGLTGYAEAADNSALNPKTELTLSAWVYLTNSSGNRSVVSKEDQYTMGINGGQLQMAVQTVKGPGWKWFGSGTVPVNTWTQVTATYDGAWIRTYINGQLQSATSYPNGLIASTTNPLRVGNRLGGNEFFAGRIDDLRISATAVGQAHNRVPQFIMTRDSRNGCPLVQAANTDLISQTFSTTDVAAVRLFAKIIGCVKGRNDVFLYLDGAEVDRTLSSPNGAGGDCWVDMHLEATLGGVAPGNHTVTIRGNAADTYGCRSSYGHISTMVFEQ